MKIAPIKNIAGNSVDHAPSAPSPAKVAAEGRPALTPGQEVRGEVLAKLAEHTYLLRVAGDVFGAEIPLPLEPGSSVQLTFRNSQPRPTFSMESPANDAASVKLSTTASLLARTVGTQETVLTKTAQIVSETPLMNSRTPDAAVVATALRNSVTFSGLFYESHLMQWCLGERPFASILREPRAGRLQQMRTERHKAGTTNHSGEFPVDADTLDTTAAVGLLTEHDQVNRSDLLLSRAALQTIREQVELLLNGAFTWRGEAIEGHELEWLVEREPEGPDAEDTPSWRTSISVKLPHLGRVCATLSFAEKGIDGIMRPELPETAALLRNEVGILEQRLAESGISLNGMVIESE